MPVNITIRAVPDEVRDELAAQARRAGQSLQQYLSRQLADIATTPSTAAAVARYRAVASGLPRIPIEQLLADLDADRR